LAKIELNVKISTFKVLIQIGNLFLQMTSLISQIHSSWCSVRQTLGRSAALHRNRRPKVVSEEPRRKHSPMHDLEERIFRRQRLHSVKRQELDQDDAALRLSRPHHSHVVRVARHATKVRLQEQH
jgi:hypothetical protein